MKATITKAAAVCGLIAAIWGGLVAADNRYVQTTQFEAYAVEDFYTKFFAAEDRLIDAESRGDDTAARRAKRDMERLKTKICKIDPEWERCD